MTEINTLRVIRRGHPKSSGSLRKSMSSVVGGPRGDAHEQAHRNALMDWHQCSYPF